MPNLPDGRRVTPCRRRRLVVEPLEHRVQPSALFADTPTAGDASHAATIATPQPLTILDTPAFPAPATAGTTRVQTAAPGPTTSVAVGAPRSELYLVDFDVPERDTLVRDLVSQPGFAGEVVELVGGGLSEVSAVLADRHGLDAIHLISHGAAGTIVLGPDELTADTLSLYSTDLRSWGTALAPGGDLLLYGCDVAADGGAFITAVRGLTGADVAASTDDTGAAALGGDWTLESATGSIETRPFVGQAGWMHTLADTNGFYLGTVGNVSGSSVWQQGQVASFGGPNLALEPAGGGATSGTATPFFSLQPFGNTSGGVSELHVVGTSVTVGVGAASMALFPGDLLLCTNGDNTVTGSDGVSVKVTKDDVFLFRPSTPGDYSSGTFRMVLDNFRNWSGGDQTWGLALVEHDTRVGEALVPAGAVLFSRNGGSQQNDVRMFTPTGVGAGTTSGPAPVVLIEGDQLNYRAKIRGLELVEADATVGGRLLPAGTLLLALDSNAPSVGANNIAVTRNDVFALSVSRTSLNGQTAVATASVVFDGSDVGLTDSAGGVGALALPAGKAAVNRPPVAADDQYSTAINLAVLSTPLTVSGPGVVANDSDPDGNPLSVGLVTGPSNGLLVFNSDGSFAYTAFLNFTGSDSFTYRVFDGTTYSAPATVSINVSVVPNRPPSAQPDSDTTPEDTPLTVSAPGVLGNDSDPDGDTLAVVVDTPPTYGSLTLLAGGGFTYTPAADWSGADSFTYHATDGSLDSAPVTVTLTVTAVNDPPTLDPLPDQAVAEDSGAVTVALTGVSAGGGESQPLTVSAISSDPSVVPDPIVVYTSPAATGTVTFSPAPNAAGTATITVTVSDGVSTTTRTFTVTVTPVNDPPTAADDAATTAEDTPVVIAVLANDADADGDALTVGGTGAAGHGAVTTDGTTVIYTPAPDWFGSDSFTYTVSDGNGGFATATVTLTVTPVNDAPVAADDGFTTPQNTPLTVPAAGVLGNDTDVDGDPLAAVLVAGPGNGALALNADGSFVYTPGPGFSGTDSFSYRASDGQAVSPLATVVLRVLPPSGRPVAADDAYSVVGGGGLTVPASGVLANDTPSGSAPLTAVLVSGPANGSLTLNADGSFTYTPAPGFSGTESFGYKATDAGGETGTARVVIQVARANRAPAGGADAVVTVAGTPVVLTAAVALANDDDPDGDSISAQLAGGAAHGTVAVAADGSFTYTPDAGFTGTDSFTYLVTDGQFVSGLVQVTVTVTAAPISDAPPADLPPPPTTDAPPATAGTPGPITTPPPPLVPLPTGLLAPSVTVSFGSVAATVGPVGEVNPTHVVSAGGATPSARNDAPLAFDAGRVYAVAGAPAAAAPVTSEVAPPPAPVTPQPAAAPTPTSPPPVAVLPPQPGVLQPAPPAPTPAPAVVVPDQVLQPLDRIRDELRAEAAERATTDSIVVAGGVAVAGTVLLNTRAVYWFLSALLARPAVWRRFDPLDVVYAWERENPRARGAGPDDSLQSMVG